MVRESLLLGYKDTCVLEKDEKEEVVEKRGGEREGGDKGVVVVVGAC